MSALDSLVNSEGYTDTDTQHRKRAAAEFADVRQLISEQMTRIQQQQAVVDAAEVAVTEANNPYATARDIINAIDALAAALAALPQPATKGTP